MKQINSKIPYAVLLCISFLHTWNYIYPAAAAAAAAAKEEAAAASSAYFPIDQSYPPKEWYLKCLCWNASWSSIEWKRFSIWWLYNNKNLNKTLSDQVSFIKDMDSNTYSNFKSSKINADIISQLNIDITCTYNNNTLTFETKNKDLNKALVEQFTKEINALITYITNNTYDIICLQECPKAFCELIETKLAKNNNYAICKNNTPTTGCCILYKKSIHNNPACTDKKRALNKASTSFNAQQITAKTHLDGSDIHIISIHIQKPTQIMLLQNNIDGIKEICDEINTEPKQNIYSIALGDFNSIRDDIDMFLKNGRFNDITYESPLQTSIDHCLFNKKYFISSKPKNVADKPFIDNINKSHLPFVIGIMKKNLIIEKKLDDFIKKYKTLTDELKEYFKIKLELFKKIKEDIKKLENPNQISEKSHFDIMQNVAEPLNKTEKNLSNAYTEFIDTVKDITYINDTQLKNLSKTPLTTEENAAVINFEKSIADIQAEKKLKIFFNNQDNIKNSILYIRKLNFEYQKIYAKIESFERNLKTFFKESEKQVDTIIGDITNLIPQEVSKVSTPKTVPHSKGSDTTPAKEKSYDKGEQNDDDTSRKLNFDDGSKTEKKQKPKDQKTPQKKKKKDNGFKIVSGKSPKGKKSPKK